jgi:hypothetical protein
LALTAIRTELAINRECRGDTFDLLTTATGSFAPPYYAWTTVNANMSSDIVVPALRQMPRFSMTFLGTGIGTPKTTSHKTLLPPNFDRPGAVTTEPAQNGGSSFDYPQLDKSISQIDVHFSDPPAIHQLETRVAGAMSEVTIDLSKLSLPTVEGAPTFAGAVVSWPQLKDSRVLVKPDARMVTVTSTYATGTMAYAVEWSIIDNSTEATARLPGLPAMFAEYDPTQQPAAIPGTASVMYADYSNIDSYDAARRLPIQELFNVRGDTRLFTDKLYSRRITGR